MKCCSNIWLNTITGEPPDFGGGGEPVVNPLPLIITFDSILNAPIADPSSVADWNAAFNPSIPFDSVIVNGDSVELYGFDGTTLTTTPLTSLGSLMSINDTGEIIQYVPNDFMMGSGVQTIVMNGLLRTGLNAGVTDIVSNFAKDCLSLTSVTCNNFVRIGGRSFSGTTALTAISCPNATVIESYAFADQYVLTDASFPNCTETKAFAFAGCPLTGTTDFSVLTYLGGSTFQGCAFTTIDVSSVILAEQGVFSFNNNLVSISMPVCVRFDDSFIKNTPALTTFYVPLAEQFGFTVNDDLVFENNAGQTITVTCPVSRQTCNAGAPDGDLVYLLLNNPLSTIVYV